ncbi:MAG: hypothetical protein K2F70_05055 [Muribaculaceae bacterium]|nr:hypothetical protein [Muribaculaceae bacterium]
MAEDTENKQQQTLPPVTISPIVRWGYRYHSVVLLVVCMLALFGVYALDKMN